VACFANTGEPDLPAIDPGKLPINFFEDFLHYKVSEGERHKGIKFNTLDDK
jgi:hypothetical protein